MRRVAYLIAGVSIAIGCSSSSGGGGGSGGKSGSGGAVGSTTTGNGGTAGSGSGGSGSGGVNGTGGAGSGGKAGAGSGGASGAGTGGKTGAGGAAGTDAGAPDKPGIDAATGIETGPAVDSRPTPGTGGTKDTGGGVSSEAGTTPSGQCSRTTLQAAVDSYVNALQTKDTTQMKLSASAKYTESVSAQSVDKVFQLGQGIWQTALPDAKAGKGLLDEDNCATFTEVFCGGSHPYVLGTRLAVQSDGTITEIGTIITDAGDWNFDEAAYQTCSDSEDWGILADADQTPADKLKEYAQDYFNLFSNSSATPPPWGSPCYRLEGGKGCTPQGDKSSPSCDVGIPSGINFTKTRWVVDVKVGGVVGITLFAGSPDSHMFRFVGGKIVKIHTLTCTGSG
jgi:hypothetical protein